MSEFAPFLNAPRTRALCSKLFANLFTRVGGPFKSLIGAMILVGLFRNGGNMSPAYVLGSTVSGWLGVAWIALAYVALV
jgi:hypothetical protein